jgi:hypothetical protein
MGSLYPKVSPMKGTEFTFFYLWKIKVNPSKTEMTVGHCSHVPLSVLYKDFQVSSSSEERDLE